MEETDEEVEVFTSWTFGSEVQIAVVLRKAEEGRVIGEVRRNASIGEAPVAGGFEKRITEIAQTCVCYGYRRLHVLLRREGWEIKAKRVYRP